MFESFGSGRFTRDPELNEVSTPNKDTVVCNFTLAIDEFRRSDGENVKYTHFFDMEAWDSGAQRIVELAEKGDTLMFKARPRQNKWTGEDGSPRSKVVFRVQEFRVFKRNKDNDNNDE